MRTIAVAILLHATVFVASAGTCCWSKWGDASSCGNYEGSGGRCNTDWTKSCTADSDCAATPTPPPTPTPPTPPPTPTPPTPPPTPSPPTPPSPSGPSVPPPQNMLGYYFFIDDCPESRLNVPAGMLSSGNAVFLSFITDDKWDESGLKLAEVAQKIKSQKPEMYVAYSIGGQTGSSNQALYDYLSGTSEDDIANVILGWKYVDGIDWDLEPPSGGVAAKYGEEAMAKKIASISSKVKAGGKHATMAGFGSWVWDTNMATLNGELIVSGALEKYGVMVYPPAQGSASSASAYFSNNWEKGAQTGPSDVKNQGVAASMLAGGISGTAKVDEAVSIATSYHGTGATSAIVWMVKPDDCAVMTGWTANNADLPQWSKVLSALSGSTESLTLV